MIIGIGTDLVQISRLAGVMERHPEPFLRRTYTAVEQAAARERKNSLSFLAGRWAAKEAVSKALRTGIGAHCSFTDVEITRNADGAPRISLSGDALRTSQALGIDSWHVSITHEQDYACAFVIAERTG